MKKFSGKLRHAMWLAAIMLFTIYLFIGRNYRFTYNHGDSMMPTFKHGEWLVVERRASLGEHWSPDKYDRVIVYDGVEKICKRVIGLEGDSVAVTDGFIYVNGKLDRTYSNGKRLTFNDPIEDAEFYENVRIVPANIHEVKVPKGHVWVVGDNRYVTSHGVYPVKDIKGVVIF